MPARRLRCSHGLTLALLLAAFGAQQAHAGLFDDEEARRQVSDLTIKTNARLETLTKGQIDLANQIQALREENAKLRGQLETQTYELESAKKRQQDFYIDLDGRVRKLETPPVVEAKPPAEAAPAVAAKPPVDPAAETRDYETALNLFKTSKVKDAAVAFEAFVRNYPDGTLTPSAQYWLGNAHYALNDCKKSIEAQKVVVARWPSHQKAPDSLINIATCQQELGDAKSAKTTLETVLAKYPDSMAAATARQRLKKK